MLPGRDRITRNNVMRNVILFSERDAIILIIVMVLWVCTYVKLTKLCSLNMCSLLKVNSINFSKALYKVVYIERYKILL